MSTSDHIAAAACGSTHTPFAERLRWALQHAGIKDPAEQTRRVARLTGVSVKTARKYLDGRSYPRTLGPMGSLARGLGVFTGWLAWGGNAPRTLRELDVVQKLARMPDEDQDKLLRAVSRMDSSSKRVRRLARLYDSGQIGPRDFLDLAGAAPSRRPQQR